MPSLLVVDDEPNVLYSLEKGLQSDSLEVITARTAKQGIAMVEQRQPSAVILDVRLPDMSGLDAFDRIRQIDARLPVIVITAHATTETAIEAMKRGAFEYLIKPVGLQQLREVVTKAIELSRLRHVPAVFGETEQYDDTVVDRIVGRSAVMQEVYKAIGRVASQDMTVLLLGESGTGKELAARAVYHHSRRSDGPFLAINCAAIPETLLESELFGHERGAFTGADRRRIGKFEQANHGTVFLDEIGDMTSATQAKVLRVLQEQRFERIGGNETIQTDVRVIAATNQNLQDLVATGRFRQDLFYRLKVFTIQLPALRERLDDVPLLVDYFIQLFNREIAKQVRAASADTVQVLEKYDWPGNVRELQSTIKYALVHASSEVLTPDCLPENIRIGTSSAPQSRPGSASAAFETVVADFVRVLLQTGQQEIYQRVCSAVDRRVLDEVLRHARGNQGQAADLLGMSRNTLRTKLRALGLSVEKQLLADSAQDAQKLREN
jgi:two-component system nitrogen regulation response regulator GlnG